MIKINKRSAPQKLIELKERIIRKGLTPEQEYRKLKNPLKEEIRQWPSTI